MKKFFIVPTTTTYYDKVSAEDKQAAVIQFADSMDSDMSAYFKAVEEEPSISEEQPKPQIHGYKYPNGDFQIAMSIIADTATGNKKSIYYTEGLLDELTINMEELSALQTSYELFQKHMKGVADSNGDFFKLLHFMTGFSFDEDEEVESKVRILVKGEDVGRVEDILDVEGIDSEWLEGDRILVSGSDAEKAISILEENGFDASVI